MIGVLQIAPSEAMQLTYRSLYQMYVGHMLNSWDQTSLLAGLTQNLMSVVCGAFGVYVRPLTPQHFHPMRDGEAALSRHSTPGKMLIEKENFQSLKAVCRYMQGKKKG